MEHFVVLREERRRVVREEQYEYYIAPPREDPPKIMLGRQAKRAEQKAYERPYLHATVINQQPPMPPKKTTFAHHEGLHQQKGPNNYVQTDAAHQGYVQERKTGNQVPPPKQPGGVMDCNEVAKLYGGVVFIDYSGNKFPVPAKLVL